MREVVVIGAGPYGLAIAANLRQRDIPFRIFGRPMSMWKEHMPQGMVLKSDGFATNIGGLPLTLERFCQETGRAYGHVGHRTPINDLIAYATAVQNKYVGPVEERTVTSLRPIKSGFQVQLDGHEPVYTERVILATGLTGLERYPEIPGLAPGQLSHASAHADLGKFTGQRVLVIGAGQSAFETAALLHEQGARVTVLSRRPAFWFNPEGESVPSLWRRLRHPNFGLGPGWRTWLWSEAPRLFYHLPPHLRRQNAYSTFGPAGSGWLKHRVIDRPIKLLVGVVKQCQGPVLTIESNGEQRRLEVDHIIAATGYQPDLRRLPFLAPVLDAQAIRWVAPGVPALNQRYETSAPGLHVTGYLSAMSWGPSMRFIYGTNFAAPHIAQTLRRSRTTVAVPGAVKAQPV